MTWGAGRFLGGHQDGVRREGESFPWTPLDLYPTMWQACRCPGCIIKLSASPWRVTGALFWPKYWRES